MIPAWLLERHPQLVQIHAALDEARSGTIHTRCPRCGELLSVVSLPTRRIVACPCGHCHARFRLGPSPERDEPGPQG